MLIVEDGTGLENAESYESVTNADSYAAAFGRTDWSNLSGATQKEVRLRLATQFIDTMFIAKGGALSLDQALMFPREGRYLGTTFVTGVPKAVRRACSELATYPGLPKLLPEDQLRELQSFSRSVEGLKTSGVYRDQIQRRYYHVAERLLAPYTDGGGSIGGLTSHRIVSC